MAVSVSVVVVVAVAVGLVEGGGATPAVLSVEAAMVRARGM
jgi:hypothetical protein